MKNKSKFIGISALIFFLSVTLNVVSASYFIAKFNGDQNNPSQVSNLTSTLKQTTTSLADISDNLVATKNAGVFYQAFTTSFQKPSHVNELTTPPFQNVGQIYWSTSYNSLVSSNGTLNYVWIGSTWLPVTKQGTISGTQETVSDAINRKLGQIATVGLNISTTGATQTNVQVSKLQGTLSNLRLSVTAKTYSTVVNNIHWDANLNRLVGSAQKAGSLDKTSQVVYSATSDSKGSYWSDAILK